jgi:glycosyltransferase involved in cell wall biosynthesis
MRIAIDGSNLRQGGGITHLVQLLAAADPGAAGIQQVHVWGGEQLLNRLVDRPWLTRVHHPDLDGGVISRFRWQQVQLTALARKSADLLFVPGGTYLGSFRPFVAMFRNMLPFDAVERRSYRASGTRVKLEVLRRIQALTFGRADGVIFLTEHARASVLDVVDVHGHQAVIPHGLDPRFFRPAPRQQGIEQFSRQRPFRWLYVSAIHRYKHPWNVVEAVAMLRAEGLPFSVELVGPADPEAMSRLQKVIGRIDPHGSFVTVTLGRPHADLPAVYHAADGFVFASTCENLPNSLLEAMAAGLPIVCSDRSPMPAILGGGGLYCDPTRPASIADAMKRLAANPIRRARVIEEAQIRAAGYDWRRCARDTLTLLAHIGQRKSCHRKQAASGPEPLKL